MGRLPQVLVHYQQPSQRRYFWRQATASPGSLHRFCGDWKISRCGVSKIKKNSAKKKRAVRRGRCRQTSLSFFARSTNKKPLIRIATLSCPRPRPTPWCCTPGSRASRNKSSSRDLHNGQFVLVCLSLARYRADQTKQKTLTRAARPGRRKSLFHCLASLVP